jgi:D-sedoheptulose 7-phosphate isomerase
MQAHISNALNEASQALERLRNDETTLAHIAKASDLLVNALMTGGKVLSCGNGGSMCDAMHFAEELLGRFRDDRPGIAAISISDASHLSCVGNDYGYEQVFARYIKAVGKNGDVLLAISTSGTSKNVVAAAQAAKEIGMSVIGLTGRDTGPLVQLSDIAIATPGGSKYADRVQELHIKVIHILIELVERHLAPKNYS